MSARTWKYIHLALVLGAALLLTACGTAAPDETKPDLAAPTIASVQPPAATAGQSVVITGTGFGESGMVNVGTVSAPPLSWSDERVEVVVPAGLEAAWQPLALSVTSAGEAQAELFLGTHFTGTGTNLQEFLDAQAAGSHVLLPPGTLDSAGAPLTLDGLHIYGSREGTQLDLGDLQIVVGLAPSASLNDLTLSVATADYLAALPDTQPLDPSWVPTAVTFDRIDLQASNFGGIYWRPSFPLPDVLSFNASHLRTDYEAGLMGLQGVYVTGSTIEGLTAGARSRFGDVFIESSSFIGESLVRAIGELDVTIKGSTLRATSGLVQLSAGPSDGERSLDHKTLHISSSVVEALGTEIGTWTDGNIEIEVLTGALELLGNERLHARNLIYVDLHNATGVTVQGNEELSAGRPAPDVPDAPYQGRIAFELLRLDGTSAVVNGNHFKASMVTLEDSAETPWPEELVGPEEPGDHALHFNDNIVYVAAPRYGRFQIVAHNSGTPCEVLGNEILVASDEGYASAYLECSAETATYGDFVVRDNEVLISGPSPHVNLAYGAAHGAFEFTRNVVQLEGPLGFYSNSALTIGDNDLSTTDLHLNVTNDEGVTTVTNNSVTARSVDGALLELNTSGNVVVTGNHFLQEALPSAGWLALDVVTNSTTALTVSDNEFSNLGRAIRLYSDGHEFAGSITNNSFDFPITYMPAAAEVAALNGAAIDLDLRSNRWGQVQTPEELASYVLAYADDTSTLELDYSTVLTD